ncbi:MAG: porin family protein, partial [Methylocystis sp.]
MATDLPSIKSTPVVAPKLMWTGFYAGLNAGGTWADSNNVNIYTWPTKPLFGYFTTAAPLNGGISSGNSLGFIGGGQIGYNLQSALFGFNFVT